jgi:hypothetical protein
MCGNVSDLGHNHLIIQDNLSLSVLTPIFYAVMLLALFISQTLTFKGLAF